MRELPAGTVTFLFTDIQGSTRLLGELGAESYSAALTDHRRVLREAFARHGGVEVDTQGDAFFFAFGDAKAALTAALEGQRGLADGPVRVRMGAHTGTPHLSAEGYVGQDVHLAARIAGAAHGAQVVVSRQTRDVVAGEFELLDLGDHRLKDFAEPVWLYQLGEGRFPPLRTISNTNLPRPASSFVGRAKEVADITALLRADARLITLTGPGGTGKTRLAIEAATDLVPAFRNGVIWVDLAPLRDSRLVLAAIAQTMGAGADPADHIGERQMLLVLDNVEHVIEAASDISRLLVACPNLRVLDTSRELLRIDGEVDYPVPPLASDEAVRLFSERSRLSPDGAIAELCRRLDNLPLAVELAAARTNVLSPTQILDRIAKRLDLLRGGRDADPRQQTLRTTIAWSCDLLDGDEKSLFGRLTVFAGGCTLEAAEEVAKAGLDTLQSLVDKSLVRHAGDRFTMLETIREFATEVALVPAEAGDIRRRHAEHYLALAEAAGVSVEGSEPIGGWERLDLVIPEQANLTAALGFAFDVDPELGLRLAVALEQFWVSQNPFEGVRWLSSLLERAPDAPSNLRARAFRSLGGASTFVGDLKAAQRAYERGLALYRDAEDEEGAATMTFRIGTAYLQLGDPEHARPLFEASLQTFRRLGKKVGECEAFGSLASLELTYGDALIGRKMLERNVEMAREVGFKWWQAGKNAQLAEHALKTHDLEQARMRTLEAVTLWQGLHDRVGKVYGLALLAWLAAEHGFATEAGTLWGATEGEQNRGQIGPWESEREAYASHVLVASGSDFERGRMYGRTLPLDDALEHGVTQTLGRATTAKPVAGAC